MALFAIWRHDDDPQAATLAGRLAEAAHVEVERPIDTILRPAGARWRLIAWPSATHYYSPGDQVWIDERSGEACVIHGIVWRLIGGDAQLLDAQAVAGLLDRPGAGLPDDVGGEYAILRLHAGGELDAFSDPAGLHQLFHAETRPDVVANRAALVAALIGRAEADASAGTWLATIGYRVGSASGWAGVRQLRPGEQLSDGRLRRGATIGPERDAPRGLDAALLDQGNAQAIAALRLAAGDGPVPLPITGGKDSRAVLALALAAGLRDRLDLFTRGYEGHPDVVVGRMIAAALGLPHRREPPLGSDQRPDWTVARFVEGFARLAFQTDGGMGGWDMVTAPAFGQETLVTGHMGEVLKAYAKREVPADLDPIALVQLQAPFDALGAVRAPAVARMSAAIADDLAAEMRGGARPGDLPDLFYLRHRVPNWLGGIRGVKSFERQPIMPLGVPALMTLAFRMTPEERRMEAAHHHLVRRHAPQIEAIPFAHQSWHAGLCIASADPILAPADMPLFGNWQYSLDGNPALRAFLADLFATTELPIWEDVDRARVIAMLREERLGYFTGICLLGLTVAVFHGAGLIRRDRIGGDWSAPPPVVPIPLAPRIAGHLDVIDGRTASPHLAVPPGGRVELGGWLHAPDWPGARPRVEARLNGQLITTATADRPRRDLAAAGIGDGAHGFSLSIDAAALAGGGTLELGALECAGTVVGGRLEIAP